MYFDKCKVYKGYFPETARNVDDRFCFVNLDMDLFIPELGGLRFFYNKMERGGVILLHDYFVPALSVKKVADSFEKEIGSQLTRIPIGDSCSIAIIK